MGKRRPSPASLPIARSADERLTVSCSSHAMRPLRNFRCCDMGACVAEAGGRRPWNGRSGRPISSWLQLRTGSRRPLQAQPTLHGAPLPKHLTFHRGLSAQPCAGCRPCTSTISPLRSAQDLCNAPYCSRTTASASRTPSPPARSLSISGRSEASRLRPVHYPVLYPRQPQSPPSPMGAVGPGSVHRQLVS